MQFSHTCLSICSDFAVERFITPAESGIGQFRNGAYCWKNEKTQSKLNIASNSSLE